MSTQPLQPSSRSRDYTARFNAVTRPAARQPQPARRLVATETVVEFLDICDSALVRAFADPEAVLLPDVDVANPRSVLMAYLLFLATEGIQPGSEVESHRIDAWHDSVCTRVWRLLGFGNRPPAKLILSMAFALLGSCEHQAPELRAFVWAIGDLAASNLLRGMRS